MSVNRTLKVPYIYKIKLEIIKNNLEDKGGLLLVSLVLVRFLSKTNETKNIKNYIILKSLKKAYFTLALHYIYYYHHYTKTFFTLIHQGEFLCCVWASRGYLFCTEC